MSKISVLNSGIPIFVNKLSPDEITIKIHRPGRTGKDGQLSGVPEHLKGDVWVAIGEGSQYEAFDDLKSALEYIDKILWG